MKPNMHSLREKLVDTAKRVGKGTRKVAAATTLAVASLSSQAQTPPPIPENPEVSIQKQDSYNALLPEGSKIGTKAVSGQTPIFYKMQTSSGNYVVDISQWSGLSIPDDAKLKAKTGHFDSFLRSLVLADAEFAKKKTVYIGMSMQASDALRLRIPEGMIAGYKIIIVSLPTANDDGNKIVVSVIVPDDGSLDAYRGKVYDYENTKSGLMAKLGGKQEVIDAIDSHPLRTIGAVSAGALGVLALGGLAGAGFATGRKNREVKFYQDRSNEKGFYMLIDNIFRSVGIREYLNDKKRVFFLGGNRYDLTPHFSLAEERGGTITLESDGKYLMPNGAMVYMADGSEKPKVTLEVFRDFLVKTKRPLPPLMPDDEGDAVPNLTERVLVNLDVQDVNAVSNPLFSTLHKIDLIIQNQGFVGKLDFRTVKGSNGRMSRFKNGEKVCEIYVDDVGRVQVIVDNVSTPEGNTTSPFEDVRRVIESIFSDVSS